MTWVEPPQPRVVHVRITELGKARACSPGALSLMHLQQALTDARVNVRSDDALNLGALARVRVFFVTITVVWCNAPGRDEGQREAGPAWLAQSPRARFAKEDGFPQGPHQAWQGAQEQRQWGE